MADETLQGTITPRPLSISGVSARDKLFDGSTAASLSGAPLVSPLGGDAVSVAGSAIAQFADSQVGSGKPVSVSGYTLGGIDAGNYRAVQPVGLTANITPAIQITQRVSPPPVINVTPIININPGVNVNWTNNQVVINPPSVPITPILTVPTGTVPTQAPLPGSPPSKGGTGSTTGSSSGATALPAGGQALELRFVETEVKLVAASSESVQASSGQGFVAVKSPAPDCPQPRASTDQWCTETFWGALGVWPLCQSLRYSARRWVG